MDYEMTVLEGMVEEIVYTNYANGYTVCTLDVGGDMVTATGCMPYLSEGESVKLTGNWTTHPSTGNNLAYASTKRCFRRQRRQSCAIWALEL